jgi:hypothetical protein
LQASEERNQHTIAKLKEAWAAELRRQKEAWAAAERAKRETWMSTKTQEIKDVTVKGLEAEVGVGWGRGQYWLVERIISCAGGPAIGLVGEEGEACVWWRGSMDFWGI